MEQFKMTIPGRLEYVQTAKMAVGSIASIGGFDLDALEDIRMAVGEACKCITCHNQAYWSNEYSLEAVLDDESLTITIIDGPEEHSLPKGRRLCLDCPQEGDLSIQIIRTIMDDMKITKEEGVRIISMRKFL